ncbi:presenilin-1-like [Ornithodoros turicata]|uniref:presenilin-1-like n=1 Tax=Ornithodoros turicata TaxID=34597 RepID=UPI00313933F4
MTDSNASSPERERLLREEPSPCPQSPSPQDLRDLWVAVDDSLQHVVRLLAAISFCMMVVIVCRVLSPPAIQLNTDIFPTTERLEDHENETQRAIISLYDAAVFIFAIAAATCLVLALFYFHFYCFLKTWIMMNTCFILSQAFVALLGYLTLATNVEVDIFTAEFVVWNLTTVGIICVYYKGPLFLQQVYLIIQSSFIALMIIELIPNWTLWLVLSFMPLWDLMAVLCVVGPLRLLIEMAREADDSILRGVVFSTGTSNVSTKRFSNTDDTEMKSITGRPDRTRKGSTCGSPDNRENLREGAFEGGVVMGLGDFVFYSVLVGKVASYGNWNLIAACFVAVLVGVCLTLLLLVIAGTPLPALPMSLALGLLSVVFSTPIEMFTDQLTQRQVFI